jgi:hypothetical protein
MEKTVNCKCKSDCRTRRCTSYDVAFVKFIVSRRESRPGPLGSVCLAQGVRQYATRTPNSWSILYRSPHWWLVGAGQLLSSATSYPCWYALTRHPILCSPRGEVPW